MTPYFWSRTNVGTEVMPICEAKGEVGAHVDAVVVAREEGADGIRLETGLDGQAHEGVMVADGRALGVQAVMRRCVSGSSRPRRAGEVDEAVGVVGVAAAQLLPLEVQGRRMPRRAPSARAGPPSARAGRAVLRGDPVDHRSVVDRIGGAVELELCRPPHLVAVLELLEGKLEGAACRGGRRGRGCPDHTSMRTFVRVRRVEAEQPAPAVGGVDR